MHTLCGGRCGTEQLSPHGSASSGIQEGFVVQKQAQEYAFAG